MPSRGRGILEGLRLNSSGDFTSVRGTLRFTLRCLNFLLDFTKTGIHIDNYPTEDGILNILEERALIDLWHSLFWLSPLLICVDMACITVIMLCC